jgi:uncharacterized protein YcfL
MRTLVCFGIALALGSFAVVGCSSEGENKPEDSMAKELEKAKKDNGITGNEMKSKDADANQKKADANSQPVSTGGTGGDSSKPAAGGSAN